MMTAFLKSNFVTDTREIGKSHEPILTLLWFTAVFTAVQLIVTIIIMPAYLVWLSGIDEFRDAVRSLDFRAVLSFMTDMPDWLLILNLYLLTAEAALPMMFCGFVEKRPPATMGIISRRALPDYLIGYAVGILLTGLSVALTCVCGNVRISLDPDIPVAAVVLYFFGYLIQGMAEEVMFRGYLMTSVIRSLKTGKSTLTAVAVSSAAFGVVHILNPGATPTALLNITLFGVFFAVYVLKTGNIWGACAAHSAWNFFQGNIFGFNVSGMASKSSVFVASAGENTLFCGGSFGLEGGLAVTIVISAAAAVMIFFVKPRRGGNG